MFICICNGVTEGQIQQAVAQGASSVRELNQQLSVASCCGKCVSATRQLIDQYSQHTIDQLAIPAS